MRWYPSKEQIKQSWEKYSLIVIGNIVFFVLLYFLSYRPNNDENRAFEFVSMAQAQETQGRAETAMVLYQKVIDEYPGTKAHETATKRYKIVKKLASAPVKKEPKMLPPKIDMEKVLNRKPAVYMATLLAKHYENNPMEKAKIHNALKQYLWIAVTHEKVPLDILKTEKELQPAFFQKAFFTIKPKCKMTSDWFFDDFLIENNNFFPWHNANIKLTIAQGEKNVIEEVRLPTLLPGESAKVSELRVQKDKGIISCKGSVVTQEGTAEFDQKL